MRFDLVSIFPQYFNALDESLIGKAKEKGTLTVNVHNLRDWTNDPHRTVDDSPYGGGAGMVMRPDIWGRALDDILAYPLADTQGEAEPRRVLAIPTPAGIPLTQQLAQDLSQADQIIVACGRYEGIDQRLSDHYAQIGVEVIQFSLGDYVLNGGEVAALVLVEAVGRLCDGVIGNPESLVEESHSSQGLLEYPAYTRPLCWRGHEVPNVLRSGNHQAITLWRRERSLERTARHRPDIVQRLDPQMLTVEDREILASCGYIVKPQRATLTIRQAQASDAHEIADLAARTFPDACPPHLPKEAITAFIEENLSAELFAGFLADTARFRIQIAVATVEAEQQPMICGYTLSHVGEAALPEDMLRSGKCEASSAYLSKCYVDSHWRGSGIAGALLEAAVVDVESTSSAPQIVLGTNIGNKRAKAFYRRHGFTVVGRRRFNVGGVENIDDILVRSLKASRQ
ncbi:tRNA (guanosine(37)-N1)-methyltransferase TrmD [Schaalia sp. lx-100]|uniref:tRNA (guanosine(37)-N1)-methyltransferase TrmD n=1 Tax=Schaalia sp. lx-100 TaxID=2899081 RepID=UPI001E41400F|nr:tRNA (guanosine(37)-N1)-methyltransferase TrmD [Schaalia sp. lx-100]MCD4557117.1 tRNA (guanosine(37)-N1)-methyltransferase TrmD [Schaalia sp. lx-100]